MAVELRSDDLVQDGGMWRPNLSSPSSMRGARPRRRLNPRYLQRALHRGGEKRNKDRTQIRGVGGRRPNSSAPLSMRSGEEEASGGQGMRPADGGVP